jgi:hypothetical protein
MGQTFQCEFSIPNVKGMPKESPAYYNKCTIQDGKKWVEKCDSPA